MIAKTRINCSGCKFFEITGKESFYNIGNCKHPHPMGGGAMVESIGIADWLTCFQAKKIRGKKKGHLTDQPGIEDNGQPD